MIINKGEIRYLKRRNTLTISFNPFSQTVTCNAMQLHTQYTKETRGSYGNAATMRVHLSMTCHLKISGALDYTKSFSRKIRFPQYAFQIF